VLGSGRPIRMLWLAGWRTAWAGHASVRVGPVGCADTGSARFVPSKPVTKRAIAVGRGTVIAKMTVFECAAVHPRHFVCEVPRGHRPPKFLIEHHRGITAITHDYAARWPEVIMAHSGFWCVIDPSRWRAAVQMQYPPQENTLLWSHAGSTPPNSKNSRFLMIS
jgi:hypothetical protein